MTEAGAQFEAQIDAAIAAHEHWKRRLLVAIESGHSDVHLRTVGRDDTCELGRWLRGDASELPGHAEKLSHVRELHAEFHRAAESVMKQAVAFEREAAEAAIRPGGDYELRSEALLEALREWRNAVHLGP